MTCIIERKPNGQVDRVFNPLLASKSKPVVELLIEHLRQNLDQEVIVDANQFSQKLDELGFGEISPNIIGETGAANIPILMQKKEVAMKMEEAGKSKRIIYEATGWEKTEDKDKWKYSLSVRPKLSLTNSRIEESKVAISMYDETYRGVKKYSGNLEHIVYNYNELLTLYPQLKDFKVNIYLKDNMKYGGMLTSILNYNSIDVFAKDEEEAIWVLVHEVQHAIQFIEGFAIGTNVRMAAINIAEKRHDNLVNADPIYAGHWFKALSLINSDMDVKYIIKELESLRDLMMERLEAAYGPIDYMTAYRTYEAFAGEVEARNAAERLSIPPHMLTQTMIYDTESVDEVSKVYKYGNSKASAFLKIFQNSPSLQFLQTSEGEIYGFAVDNKIYLDPAVLNSNTLFHEFSHINDNIVAKAAASGDKKAQALISKRNSIVDPAVEKVKENLSQKYGKNVTQGVLEAQANQVISDGSSNLIFSEFSDSIELELVETPLEERGQGKAKGLVNQLKSKAEALRKPITLMVSPRDKNTDFDSLVKFYKNLGFTMQEVNGFESDFEMIYYPKSTTVDYQVLSKFRDNNRFAFSDLVYPDVVFKDIKTEAQAKIAVNFYNKIVNKFNNLFDRKLKLDTEVNANGNFNIVVTYETGLQPKYFAYPTSTIGQHEVVSSIDKNVPLTSLRHELIHEMLVKHITDKFERINNLDNSAEASSIDEVQRNRAYNYSLEDVFFERVVENIERNPDFVDTFPISSFGVDVTNRLKVELEGKELSKENVSDTLNSLLEGSNEWLKTTLLDIFNKIDYTNVNDVTEVATKVGSDLEAKFNLAKNIFSNDLQSKIFEFTEVFNAEYKGVLTRLGKQVVPGITPGNRLFNEPLPDAIRIAKKFMGDKFVEPTPVVSLDKELSKRIADAYTNLEHNPSDSLVKEAYKAMVAETLEQFKAIIEEGYTVELSSKEPYSNSEQMLEDLRLNKTMKVLSTSEAYGEKQITEKDLLDNPLLELTEFKDINDKPLFVNDIFRFVHDFFGHAELGNGFGPIGEENAWRIHSNMYSPLARRAMTTETRGQNSFVNFSGVNDEAFKLRDEARRLRKQGKTEEANKLVEKVSSMMNFAEQKLGLLPEEFSRVEAPGRQVNLDTIIDGKPFSELTVQEALDKGFIVHNGTDRITKIDLSKMKGGARAVYGPGMYFTDNQYKAADYGTVSTFVDATKLNILDTKEKLNQEFVDKADSVIPKQDDSTKFLMMRNFHKRLTNLLSYNNSIDDARKEILSAFLYDQSEVWTEMLMRMGYNAVKNGYEYVLFDEKAANEALVKPSNTQAETYGIDSGVYAQRANESDEQWTERLRGEVWARMIGEEGEKIASEIEQDLNLKSGSILDSIKQWLKSLVDWIKNNLPNFKDKSADEILKMSMKEFIRTSAADLLSGNSRVNLAPNGKPSNLNSVQYAQVRTPEFKNWFGDWEKGIFTDRDKFLEYKHKTGTARQNLLDIEYLFDENDTKNIEIARKISAIQKSVGSMFDTTEQDALRGSDINVDEFIAEVDDKFKEAFDLVETLDQTLEVVEVKKSMVMFTPQGFEKWLDYKNVNISKVIDENGEPLVVYHGGLTNIDMFKPVAYFSDAETASNFADPIYRYGDDALLEGEAPVVTPAFLNLRNPKRVSTDEQFAYEVEMSNVKVESVKKQGFDSIIFDPKTPNDNYKYYVALEPNQIKSSTGNNGNFSTNYDRIDFNATTSKIGFDSELYNSIVALPFISNEEQALEIYFNVFSDSFKKQFGDWEKDTITSPLKYNEGEPKLFFYTPSGLLTTSYKEALNSTNSGDIKVGFVATDDIINTDEAEMFESSLSDFTSFGDKYKLENPDSFIEVGSVSSDTNPSNLGGFINRMIKTGYMSEYKVKTDNGFKLSGSGESMTKRAATSAVLVSEAKLSLGPDSVIENEDGTIELNIKDSNILSLKDSSGMIVNHNLDSLLETAKTNPNKVRAIVGNLGSLLYHKFRQSSESLFGESRELTPVSEKEEMLLKTQLMSLLAKLGFSATTIAEYSKNYKLRNGVDLSVNALVDMANNVVAFAEGQDTVNNLAEETAHIIVEGIPNKDELNSVLPLVESTKQWADFSAEYYEKYGQMYGGAELDTVVRKEILGKILAAEIVNRFSSGNSVSSYLAGIFSKFLESIRSFFTPNAKTQLNTFVKKAANIAVRKDADSVLDKNAINSSALVMYNTGNAQVNSLANRSAKLTAQIEKLKQSLELRKSTQQKLNDPEVSRLNTTIARLNDDLSRNDLLAAAAAGNAIHENQIVHLERQLASYKGNQGSNTPFFNVSDQTTYNYLKNIALPIMKEMRGLVNGIDENLTNRLDSQIKSINNLEGSVFAQQNDDVEIVIDNAVGQYNITDEEKNKIRQSFQQEQKDVSAFQGLFGQLGHASNAFLNLLGRIINRNYFHAETETFSFLNPTLDKAQKAGWNMKDFARIIKKDSNGKNTGYLLAPLDYAKFDADKKEFISNLYDQILTQDQKDALNGAQPNKTILTEDQLREFVSKENDWKAINEERAMLPAYYQEVEAQLNQANVGKANRAFLGELSARNFKIKTKYRDANGKIDYSAMTQSDLDALAQIAIERKARKSNYDAITGELKTGDELLYAQELQALDALRAQVATQRGNSRDFYDALLEVETNRGTQAAFEFLTTNGGITFSDNFWNSLSNNESIQARMTDVISDLSVSGDPETLTTVVNALTAYTDAVEARKQIIKQYATPNNPAEINALLMPEAAMNNILILEETIQDNIVILNTQLAKLGENPISSVLTENTLNEAYHKALIDSGKSEMDFLQLHMNPSNKYKFNEFKRRAERMANDRSDYMEKGFRRFMAAQYNLDMEDTVGIKEFVKRVGAEKVSLDYGRTRVGSYFKRFAPMGYEEMLHSIKNGASVVDLVNKIERRAPGYENYSISTRFEWADTSGNNNLVNPDYVADEDSGFSRPNKIKYRDDEYYNKYNPDASGRATTNVQDWEMTQDFKNIMKESLSKYGEKNRNVYRLPMKGRTSVEKRLNPNIQNIKESIKDVIFNRVDDMQYGAMVGGLNANEIGAKIIPKYYLTDLESMEDISGDLLNSYASILREANLYNQRINSVGEVLMLQQKLLHSSFENGKTPEATNTYKMFNNFVDGYFYGIKSTKKKMVSILGKEVDLSKIAVFIDNKIRKVNVGFSLPIALSSAMVSNVNFAIENTVGEHVHSHSSKWATTELAKLLPTYATNYGKVGRTDKLYLLGQTFGFHSVSDKTNNAGYNKVVKAMSDLPFSFMNIASAPHSNNVLLSVLDDYRLVDGKFFTFNEFKKKSDVFGLSKKEILSKWDTFRDNSMYNLLEENNGEMKLNAKTLELVGEEYANEQLLRARSKIREVNGNIDALISDTDKSAATRHFLWNFVTAHRGWLGIGIQRRFKKQHFNFNTGEFEEGHYISFANLINDTFAMAKKKGYTKFLKVMKEEWGNMDEVQKRNIMRVGRDMGVFAILTALTVLVAAADDDEKNKDNWPIHFLSYLYFRTVSEAGSSSIPFGVTDAIDVVKTPFVAVNSLQSMMQGLSLDEVQSGPYEGMSKLSQAIIKQTQLRHFFDLQGIKKKSDYFRLLNSGTLFMAQKESKEDKEEEDNSDNLIGFDSGFKGRL